MSKQTIGTIEWHDLTVSDAQGVKDFYQKVVGWDTSPVSMGDYNDFNCNQPEGGATIAGICHARGPNQDLPAQWLMYVRVENVTRSIAQTISLGGQVIAGPKAFGDDDIVVIQDPAGAVIALVGAR